jgi:hypothetical protein
MEKVARRIRRTGEDNAELALEGVELTDLAQDSYNNDSFEHTFIP